MKYETLVNTTFTQCNCIGPQNGQPLYPCQMRNVQIKDGRYVRPEIDLGPAVQVIDTSKWPLL